jgi:cytoskeletal protein RodZ
MIGLGDALRNEREKRNISLEHISTKTNISLNALTALENEEIEYIPGAFYFKNYIKSYLHAIDADVNKFLEIHKEKIDALYKRTSKTSESYFTRLRYSRFKKRNIFFSFFIPTVVFILVFYLLYIHREDIFRDLNLSSSKISIPEIGINLNALDYHKKFSIDYSPLHVSIEFFDQCWIQVYRGREKIIEQVYEKGNKLSVKGYELIVYVDNPARLRFLLNGQEVTYLRKLSKPERIVITPVNIDGIFNKGEI